MRFLTIAAAATLLMLPAVAPAAACELDAFAAEAQAPVLVTTAVTQELSAEEKKMDDKKPMKKTAKKHTKKMKKEKVEYMRAAPMK